MSPFLALKGDIDKLRNEKEQQLYNGEQYRKELSIYKTDTKNAAKRLRATTFAIAKLEER